MCLPPHTKLAPRAVNAAAAPPQQPGEPAAAYAAAAYSAAMYAPFYSAAGGAAPSAYQPYAPKYNMCMEDPPFFEGLPFVDSALVDMLAAEPAVVVKDPSLLVPTAAAAVAIDPLDLSSWFYSRAPSAESLVPESSVLSPFEEPQPSAFYPSEFDVDTSMDMSQDVSGSSSPATVPTTAGRKNRKRKLASDLSREELAKTREVNRLAAQRHRSISKQKQNERKEHFEAMGARNDKLRQEIQHVSTELSTLKRLVLSMYGSQGPRHTALVSHLALPPNMSIASLQHST